MTKLKRWVALALGMTMICGALGAQAVTPAPGMTLKYQLYASELLASYLKEADGKNQIISPMSLYLALAMLAEGSQGDTKKELLTFLRADSLESLRAQSAALSQKALQNTPVSALSLANALWLSNKFEPLPDFVARTEKNHQAEVHVVDFGDDKTSETIAQWTREKTRGLVEVHLTPSPMTALILMNALYFKDGWTEPFAADDTKPGSFTFLDGKVEPNMLFMSRLDQATHHVRGANWTRASLDLIGGGRVDIILPDEGTKPADLAKDASYLAEALFGGERVESHISWHLPRLDLTDSLSMNDMLSALGLKTMFTSQADFSALSKTPTAVSLVQQDSRIKLDEEKVEAAAVTTIVSVAMAVPPPKTELQTIEMNVNRPFLLAIYAKDGSLAFAGAVYQP